MKDFGWFLFDIGGSHCITTFLRGGSFIVPLSLLVLGLYLLMLDWACQKEPETKDENTKRGEP
jgi:hypothetical protein